MFSGSQLFHAPLLPRSSSQQFVTRNGGSTSATTDVSINHLRQRGSTHANASATMKPSAPASSVVSPLTRRLLKRSGQFIECVDQNGERGRYKSPDKSRWQESFRVQAL